MTADKARPSDKNGRYSPVFQLSESLDDMWSN